jgi:hypothetical protein
MLAKKLKNRLGFVEILLFTIFVLLKLNNKLFFLLKFIEKMSELIRQGIEKANEDLKKENDQKLMQQVFKN